jgi:tetratricopeptide (TPR) repeat protein
MSLKVENALVSYAVYMFKMVWPTGLAIFHPFPAFLPAWKVVLSIFTIVITTLAALLGLRRAPYLIMGWLWFLGTLATVSGIVQGGLWPAYAERWVYVPYIGLFIAVTWGASDLLKGFRHRIPVLASVAAAVLIALSVLTWTQTSLWRNDVPLFSRSLELHPENNAAHSFLGAYYLDRGEYGKALPHYEAAHELIPGNPFIANNLGVVYMKLGKADGAIQAFKDALQVRPNLVFSRVHLGNLLLGKGESDQAISQCSEALRIDPQNAEAYACLGKAYRNKSDLPKAAESFRKAAQLGSIEAENSLRNLGRDTTGTADGGAGLEREIQADPGNPGPYLKLAALKQQQGDAEGALTAYRKALSIKPDSVAALYGMVLIHAGRQEYGQAIELLQSMRTIQPDNPENYYNLACMYARWNRPDEAISWLKQALDHGFANIDLIRKDPDLAGIRDTQFVKGLLAQEQTKGK